MRLAANVDPLRVALRFDRKYEPFDEELIAARRVLGVYPNPQLLRGCLFDQGTNGKDHPGIEG